MRGVIGRIERGKRIGILLISGRVYFDIVGGNIRGRCLGASVGIGMLAFRVREWAAY